MYIEVKEKILPTNDYLFKKIFGQVGKEDITMSLLNSILNDEINSIKLDCNPILEKNIYNDKLGILDIKAKLNNNIICNVEMQIANQKNIEKRLLYYWSKLYTSGIKEGEDYRKLNKTIVILIADFELDSLKETLEYHTKWKIKESNFGKIVLTDIFEINIIELPKIVYILNREYKKDLLLWLKFIKNPNMLEESEVEKNKEIKKAKEEYEKFNEDEYEQYLAHLREKYVLDTNSIYGDGVEDGIEQGIEQGINQERIEIAKKLLKEGINIEMIIRVTGLNKEEIVK